MQDKLNDCYFYFENEQPSDDDHIKIMCMECRTKCQSDIGWFWQGSIKGYAPYDFICDTCGFAVHKQKGRNEKI